MERGNSESHAGLEVIADQRPLGSLLELIPTTFSHTLSVGQRGHWSAGCANRALCHLELPLRLLVQKVIDLVLYLVFSFLLCQCLLLFQPPLSG